MEVEATAVPAVVSLPRWTLLSNVIPAMFAKNGSSLYDAKRNPSHLPPYLVRLSALSNTTNNSVVINENLNQMYQAMVTASTAELFMGKAYRYDYLLRQL